MTMRRAFKWFVYGWVALVVASLVIIVVATALHEPVKRDSILRARLDGELVEVEDSSFASLLSEETPLSTRALTESIRQAAKDERIRGLVLEIKDPRVSPAQLEE